MRVRCEWGVPATDRLSTQSGSCLLGGFWVSKTAGPIFAVFNIVIVDVVRRSRKRFPIPRTVWCSQRIVSMRLMRLGHTKRRHSCGLPTKTLKWHLQMSYAPSWVHTSSRNSRHVRAIPWRSATYRQRPAPWPRARTGARTATLPWWGGRGAGKGVPPPLPQRRRPTAVVQRPRAGSSPRRAARLRAAGGAADTAHRRARGIDRRALGASTAPADGVSNRQRAAVTEPGAQARSPAGHRGRFEPRKTLRAVAARNSGRRGPAAPPPGGGRGAGAVRVQWPLWQDSPSQPRNSIRCSRHRDTSNADTPSDHWRHECRLPPLKWRASL